MEETGWSALQSSLPYSTIVKSDVMLGCNENMKKARAFLEQESLDMCDGWD